MTSKVMEFARLQSELKRLEGKVESLNADPAVKHVIELENRIAQLIAEFDSSPKELIEILKKSDQFKTPRKKKAASVVEAVYVHPETGERLEVKTGRKNRVLAFWISSYGEETVNCWKIDN